MIPRIIPDFPAYAITSNGKVWSYKTKRFLKPGVTHGYEYVNLREGKRTFPKRVHRLVLETFVGPCPDGMEGCHGDGGRRNNRVSNLRWDTRTANIMDAIRHGTWNNGE